MSHIVNYYNRIEELKKAGGSDNETSIRKAFLEMVQEYAKEHNLIVVDELKQEGSTNRPDASLQTPNGFLNYGLIENKDVKDDIEAEIQAKIKKGYKTENIIFENTKHLVLYQNGKRVNKIRIAEGDLIEEKASKSSFESIIKQFVSFEPAEVKTFKEALEKFKENVPELAEALKARFKTANIPSFKTFLEDLQHAINKQVSEEDAKNIIVQHILTKDIFNAVLNDDTLLSHNSIAKSIEAITKEFLSKDEERELKSKIRPYYNTISATAQSLHEHSSKQSFLKTFYESFYKAYNPKKADRQGVEYTPIEVVKFMVKFTNLLLNEHFEKTLDQKNVEILDPCTGTGIFITEVLQEIRTSENFWHKYKEEIFANEIDILPYYIANLNIEYIAKELRSDYKSFENIVLVDTLSNLWGLKEFEDAKLGTINIDLFSQNTKEAFSENNKKIAKQNEKPLMVIIGNPPYNANQQNENDNNKNFAYPHIDKRIKETYVKKSTAQKTKQYDLYKRFIRWASDRMKEGGIIALITNNSYLKAKQDDGFRACIREEFDHAYFIDLKGNSRLKGEEALKEGGNIFNIRVGVGIMFLVKNGDNEGRCKINYISTPEYAKKEEKLSFLNHITSKLKTTTKSYKEALGKFESIKPSTKNQWLEVADTDFEDGTPLISKEVKNGKSEEAIFKTYSLGVATNRDKWVYDVNKKNLEKKIKKFIEIYDEELERNKERLKQLKERKGKVVKGKIEEDGADLELRNFEYSLSGKIKWTRLLKKNLIQNKDFKFSKSYIRNCMYRPFVKKYLYFFRQFNEEQYQLPKIFPNERSENKVICVAHGTHGYIGCEAIMISSLTDLHFFAPAGTNAIPLNTYTEEGACLPNLTEYGKKVFEEKYGKTTPEEVFNYCYAVLNSTNYKEKYKENLKVSLPRIPLLNNFKSLAKLGGELATLHLNYEELPKYELSLEALPKKKISKEAEEILKTDFKPNVYLKIEKEAGTIKLDDDYILKGIPKEAFEYKIGGKSPIEWVCNDNCFSPLKYDLKAENEALLSQIDDYNWQEVKENLLDLIPRLVSLSLKTMAVIKAIDENYE